MHTTKERKKHIRTMNVFKNSLPCRLQYLFSVLVLESTWHNCYQTSEEMSKYIQREIKSASERQMIEPNIKYVRISWSK